MQNPPPLFKATRRRRKATARRSLGRRHHISVKLYDDEYALVERVARGLETSTAQLLRDALAFYLAKSPPIVEFIKENLVS